MKRPRIKVVSSEEPAAYHVMSRCVNGESLFDETSREVLRKMIWKVSEFCHVEVITYAILSNHFHILIRIPQRRPVKDKELLRRYQILHPQYNAYQAARHEVIADWLKRNTREGQTWRAQQLALMFDLSAFMKLLKQRFSQWFNNRHQRFGPLWAERFKSVMVNYEDDHTLLTMAAYIDLNAVRKSLVRDPKDYRFCGYSEALIGNPRARQGLRLLCPSASWSKSQAVYREILYGTGSAPRENKHQITHEDFLRVMQNQGHLSLAELLRLRWRFLTTSSLLGSAAFVQKHLTHLLPKHTPTYPPPVSPWGQWHLAHRIRNSARTTA